MARELGDFQTPPALADAVCRALRLPARPRAIVEPTCGVGNLLFAAQNMFPGAGVVAADIDPGYVRAVRARGIDATCESFFDAPWPDRLARLPEPILVIGNPPWVTNADARANVPAKSNFHGRAGLDALTGKSNFDISEWMLTRLVDWLAGRDATLAVLCKTAVARKVLAHAWRGGVALAARIHAIDAAAAFSASVDACLLVCELGRPGTGAGVYASLDAPAPHATLGWDGELVADAAKHARRRHLAGASPHAWRSGIKHDCAAVMELREVRGGWQNRAGERVRIEDELVYPLLKSSDLARGATPARAMLVTQRAVGEDTAALRRLPRTWRYLTRHRARLDRRASVIYRGKPPFSIFGVGAYTFQPWKVAIAGLAKELAFRVVGPHRGKPVVLDDTCYFVGCASEAEARELHARVSSPAAREFYEAYVFWDAKRPITSELLGRLDTRKL